MTSSLEENKENILSIHLQHFARKNKPLSPFISKLCFLLSCVKHHDAIHWSSDGRSIVITDIDTFKKSVLENQEEMFKTRNFTSFVRQLNLYGFRKVPSNGKSDPTTNMKFEHIHFRRERPDLMQLVHRTCITNKKRADPQIALRVTSSSSSSSSERNGLTTKLSPVLFVKHEDNKHVRLPDYSKGTERVPLGLSLLQNLKSQTEQNYTKVLIENDLVYQDNNNDSLIELSAMDIESEQEIQNGSGTSHEHNYALPISSNGEMDEEQIYQFLNRTFKLEKEVVQTLLSLPDSKPNIPQFNFDNLKTLADVSLNSSILVQTDDGCNIRSVGVATPRETLLIPSTS